MHEDFRWNFLQRQRTAVTTTKIVVTVFSFHDTEQSEREREQARERVHPTGSMGMVGWCLVLTTLATVFDT
uniref:Uncharacterized protein n=1 Tax=Octopus bimaculoides TaxID=37653 RepID=A0A0L8HQW6_OCTBM